MVYNEQLLLVLGGLLGGLYHGLLLPSQVLLQNPELKTVFYEYNIF